MTEQTESLKLFLRSHFLFADYSDEQIDELAANCREKSLPRGEILYKQGEDASDFFLVWVGKIRLITSKGEEKPRKNLAALIFADYFGEDCFFGEERLDTAVALEPTKLLIFERDGFQDWFQKFPQLEALIETTAQGRQLARNRNLRWLVEDEAIYFVVRKHPFFLGVYLLFPALFALGGLVLSFYGWMAESPPLYIFGGIVGFISIIVFLWIFIDWENDYYVVTSQRALWVEKEILIYDSRQEVPLETVLSTKKVFNPTLRRLINYGTVIVNTYTGSITMRRAWKPDQLILFIDGFKARNREVAKQIEDKAMETAIRKRLGLPLDEPQEEIKEEGQDEVVEPSAVSEFLSQIAKFFMMRYQEGEDITYRKHWFILFKKIWLPLMVGMVMFLLGVYLFVSGVISGVVMTTFWILVLIFVSLWLLYRLVDWHDDIYVLTRDSIIDIEKKPLTREEKRVAKLENILSLENEREGLTGMLLDFGTVTINIGTEKFTFDKVKNPVQVQYEIFDRMNAHRSQKEKDSAARERDRMANILAIFHEQVGNSENNEDINEVSG